MTAEPIYEGEVLPAETTEDRHEVGHLSVGCFAGASRGADRAFLKTMSPGQSRQSMARSLRAVTLVLTAGGSSDPGWVAWHDVRNIHCQAIRTDFASRVAPATANHRLAALRGVLKAAWRAQLMDSDDYHRTVDFSPVRGSREPAGRALDVEELRSLFTVCADEGSVAGARDRALFAILAGLGLRRTEAAELPFTSVDLGEGDGRGAMRIIGKGNKERVLPISGVTLVILREWVERTRGTEDGSFLLGLTPGKQLSDDGISADGILRVCKRRAKQAGVREFSPHDLRRSFASRVLDYGGDISGLQSLMGHSNVATTQRYDRRGERVMEQTEELATLPYVPMHASPSNSSLRDGDA